MVHMGKVALVRPMLILLYGMPGSGKTSFARQLCTQLEAAHVQGDRIRAELFQSPTYSKDENHLVASLMTYMAGEFLSADVTVVYDTNAMRAAQRRALRNLAVKAHAETSLVWLQIDPETAFQRCLKRDKRRIDDRYAKLIDGVEFKQHLAAMQNPAINEQYVVVSGKHLFSTQKNAIFRMLRERRLIDGEPSSAQLSKPGLINLVPSIPARGRVDLSRRNIVIR